MLKSLTRVLVLSGIVTLTTAMGSIDETTGDLLAVKSGEPPTKVAVQANSDFALDLYKQLAKENAGKNMFFSPYSVSSALAMTIEGARGQTADEMGQVLRYPAASRRIGDDAQRIPWQTSMIHTGMAELNRTFSGAGDLENAVSIRKEVEALETQRAKLHEQAVNVHKVKELSRWIKLKAQIQKLSIRIRELALQVDQYELQVDQYELNVANALWSEKTYPFRKEFFDTINDHYDTGGVFPVDFAGNAEAERVRINQWVEQQTKERIKDLIPSGAVDNLTKLVLTNAIYFKGEWSTPFLAELTKPADFTLASGEKTSTPLMHAPKLDVARYGAFTVSGKLFDTPTRIRPNQTDGLYPADNGFAMVELPYTGDDLSMVVIAPNSADGLGAIEQQMTSQTLSGWVEQLKKRETHVYLPKFKMEIKYTLGQAGGSAALQKMGMVNAFTDRADFSGMNSSERSDLYISQVFHKAFVEVNEKGTEAAAATTVFMVLESRPRDVPFTPEFRADRPFLFLIRDTSTGTILFMGRMTQP